MTNVFVDKFSRTARRDTFRSVTRRTARGAACASLLGAVALTLFSGGANAATATGTLNLAATVISSCSIGGASINFGLAIDPVLSGPTLSSTAGVNVKCSNTTPYSIALNEGLNGTDASSRKLKTSGGATLAYQLYSDAAKTVVWSATGSALGTPVTGTGSGAATSLTIYGVLLGLNSAAPGAYSDTVTITITY